MAHVELIRYTAKRTATGLKDLKREVIKTLKMDPNRLINELAKILEPGFHQYMKKVEVIPGENKQNYHR